MRKMFPKHGRNIISDPSIKTAIDILVKLYDQGFSKVTMVVGSDRVNEFSALSNKYNGVKARHGFYNFEGGVNIVSAGERDPDADDVSGMSASKMRLAASNNDFVTFSKGLPSGLKDGKEIFDTLRKAMGIKETSEYHNHIQLDPISPEREAFVKGELFAKGDDVILKESDEVGKIVMLGANYILVELHDGRKLRKWLKDVEKIISEEKNTDEGWLSVGASKVSHAAEYKDAAKLLQQIWNRKKKENKHSITYYAAQVARQYSKSIDTKTLASMVQEATETKPKTFKEMFGE